MTRDHVDDRGPVDAELSSQEGVVEGVAVTFTGPARFRRRLDGEGRVAIEDDGSIVAEWFLQDADGSGTAWRTHRYSARP